MTNLSEVVSLFTNIGLKLIPFLGMVAFLVFVFGVAKFIKSTGDESKMKDSKQIIVWGVIGLFIMITIWGIITFLRSELGFTDSLGIPQIKITS